MKMEKVIMTTNDLDVRSGPGTNYDIIRTISKHSKWYVKDHTDGWIKLGSREWICAEDTKISAILKTVITTAKLLNVRKEGTHKAHIGKVLKQNSIVDVLEVDNGWYKIGNNEWICGYYTKIFTSHCAVSTTPYSWYYIEQYNNKEPEIKTPIDVDNYNLYYVGNTYDKVTYLTFDLTNEEGYTDVILDTLKANDAKATFFATGLYINENPDMIKKILKEGHIIGSYSKSYKPLTDMMSDLLEFYEELTEVEEGFQKLTNKKLSKIIRPPYGMYSEKMLCLIKQMGYKIIFWSLAYKHDNVDKIKSSIHNGAIIRLNTVCNKNVLQNIIDIIKEKGYKLDILDI
jgi:peptidoglycan-N-acetylmuramic acid deacetylase